LPELERLLEQLIAIPSVMGDETTKAKFLADYLSDWEPELQPVVDGTVNLWCHAPGDGALVLLCAHIDTVPPAPGWEAPHAPRREGGNLVGLGAADMQAGLAIAVETFRACAGESGRRPLSLLLTCDEEGWCRGINAALPRLRELAPELVLVPEPSGERVVLSAPGRAVFRLELETAGGHATREGESALARMAEIALEIEAMVVAGSQVVLEFTSRARGLSHPQDAQIVVDRHLVPGELREAAREALAQLDPRLAVAEAERPTPPPEAYAAERTPSVERLLALSGHPPGDSSSVGDFNFLATVAPIAILGPEGGNLHAPEEWVSLASVRRVYETYLRFLREG